jgi:predicted transposase/invertase (TIGR01784 family)
MEPQKREYKDTVFRTLFSSEPLLRSLLNAISGSTYDERTPLHINTLDNKVFKDRNNDVSCIVDGKLVVFIEHQSTINLNMPLRMLLYISELYNLIIDNNALYREKQIPLPRPVFYVLYNGTANFPEQQRYRLSDAFMPVPGMEDVNLELEVQVVNVNKGHNPEALTSCAALGEYAFFVDKVRSYQRTMKQTARNAPINEAIRAAIDDCIANNVLKDFLKKHRKEVMKMFNHEFNLDDAKQVWQEEKAMDIAEALLNDGFDVERAARLAQLPLATVQSLYRTARATA